MIPVSLLTALAAIEGLSLRRHEPLARHNVFRAGGEAALWLVGDTEEALVAAAGACRAVGVKVRPVEGLDWLAHDGGVDGACLRPGRCGYGIERTESGLSVGAWHPAAAVARYAEREALAGLDALAGWPGTVGEALRAGRVQGRARVLKGVRIGEVDKLLDSHLLLRVELEAWPAVTAEVEAHGLQGIEARRGVGPGPARVFDDPGRGSAAELLADAGLCGVRLRSARLGIREPNCIPNLGDASAEDVLLLVKMAQDRVKAHSGIALTAVHRARGQRRRSHG